MVLSKLVIIAPDGARRTYQLTRYPIIIGTDQACDITVVASDKVAPRHIRIEESLLTGMPLVVDLGVGQTTQGNVKIDRHEIKDRDLIQIADIELFFLLPRVKSPTHTPIVLEILSGKLLGQKIPLRRSMTVGRKPTNDLVIPQKDVSGTHARFDFVDGVPIIEDMQSRNGTCVNGEIIPPHDPRVLEHGDLIDLASVGFLVHAEGYALQPLPSLDASDSDTSLPNIMNAPRMPDSDSAAPARELRPTTPSDFGDYDEFPPLTPAYPPFPAAAADDDTGDDEFPPLPPLR